MLIKVNRPMLK